MQRLIISAICLLGATTINAATIHVPADQPTIQAGIDAVVSGDTVLVAFLFQGGPPLVPSFIGDINGDCQGNVADLTYFVAYLFQSSDAPKVGCTSAKAQ